MRLQSLLVPWGFAVVALACSGDDTPTDAADVAADTVADVATDADAIDIDAPEDTVEPDDAGADAETDDIGQDPDTENPDTEDVDTGVWDHAVSDDALTTCGPWRDSCEGVCRYTMVDERACGDCASLCAPSEVCEQGTCVAPAAVAPPCSDEVLAEVLAEATTESPSVDLTCSLMLAADDVVTKSIRLIGPEASGVVIDCQGATLRRALTAGGPDTLQIQSRRLDTTPTTWERPTDITVRDCRIEGSIRVQGQGPNGEGEDVRVDSLTLGHRERAQLAAPTRVRLERITLVGAGRIPLYLAPGTTRVTLQDSEITGISNKTSLYLDAESGHNRILHNRFSATLGGDLPREHIAVDGSAGNLIAGNTFEGITNGGVFVYRNCGEGGTIRHQEPRRNVIAGNVFVHGDTVLLPYSIWIGSRNLTHSILDFCELDDGYDFGSSASDLDFAGDNVVVDNVFVDGGGLEDGDSPTWISGNGSATSADGIPSAQPAVCVVFQDLMSPLLFRDGELWEDAGLRCADGSLVTP